MKSPDVLLGQRFFVDQHQIDAGAVRRPHGADSRSLRRLLTCPRGSPQPGRPRPGARRVAAWPSSTSTPAAAIRRRVCGPPFRRRQRSSSGRVNQNVEPRPDLAFHADLPAHQLDEALADRQPQARAAVLAGGGRVGLARKTGRAGPMRSAGMPMPVSETREADQRRIVAGRKPSAGSTRTVTSPASVNLMALPMRLTSTCRRRPPSPRTRRQACGAMWLNSWSPFLAGLKGQRLRRFPPPAGPDRSRARPAPACRPRSWRNRGCR